MTNPVPFILTLSEPLRVAGRPASKAAPSVSEAQPPGFSFAPNDLNPLLKIAEPVSYKDQRSSLLRGSAPGAWAVRWKQCYVGLTGTLGLSPT